MGVSRVRPALSITAETEADTIAATMHYLVGFGLSRWHMVDQDLTMIYLMLVCPVDAPVDGALATIMNIQTTDGKITLLSKVLTQVLFQDRLNDFRTEAKKSLNRIRTINETRNDLAHGWVRHREGHLPVFQPFGNMAHDFRVRSLKGLGAVPSTIVQPKAWDVKMLTDKVEYLKEGPIKSDALRRALGKLFEDERTTLETAPRMTLDQGIPFDPNPRETPMQSEK